jgi:hypothetical protein
VIVPLTSRLYSRLPNTAEFSEGGSLVPLQDLYHPTSEFFSLRLFQMLKDICDGIKGKWTLPPCLAYLFSQRCPDGSSCDRDHLVSRNLEHLEKRLVLWCSLLPLAAHLRKLALRLKGRRYEYNECGRHCRLILDALV